MIEVWYIRHGESTANAGMATNDPGTIPLTPLGQEQARKASFAFQKKPDLIITSRYARAQQTAQVTADRFPQSPVEIWDIHEFTYLSPTAIGNTNLHERRPISKAFWDKCDPEYTHGEDAESFCDLIERVKIMQKRLLEKENSFVAVFSHGYIIKAALWANLVGSYEVTPEYMHNFETFHKTFDLPNCAIIKAEHRANETLFSGLITEHLR